MASGQPSGAMDDRRLNLSAGLASVAVALLLVGLKLWALAATGALSVAASLTDSGLDLIASLAGLAGIAYAARPPDEDHSFGHSSAEDLVALGQALLVTASAAVIGWAAVGRLGEPPALTEAGTGLVVMAVSVVITAGLVAWQGRVARRTGSKIVAADRLHYLSDMLPAIGAMLALVASSRFGVGWVDPAVALAACLMLVTGARRIGLAAWDALMDRAAEPALVAEVERIVGSYPGVRGFHDLRTRTSGDRVFVQVHLELDGDQSLRAAHAISAGVRRALLSAIKNADVIIHQDPV
jgi:ferrous-iron efflux pump FieF